MNEINLNGLAQGAVDEQFQLNLQTVIDNIYDPNTSSKGTRKLTIELAFKPDADDREMVSIIATTKLTLAPVEPVKTKVILNYNPDTKHVQASEWLNQMKGQLSLDETKPKNVVEIKSAVKN